MKCYECIECGLSFEVFMKSFKHKDDKYDLCCPYCQSKVEEGKR